MDVSARQNRSDAKQSRWLNYSEVMSQTGYTRAQVGRLVAKGLLTVRKVPGIRTEIELASLERLLDSCVKPASIGG